MGTMRYIAFGLLFLTVSVLTESAYAGVCSTGEYNSCVTCCESIRDGYCKQQCRVYLGPRHAPNKKKAFSATRVNSHGQHYTTSYYFDGTTFTKSTRLDGTCCMTSPGRWRRENGRICETYEYWQDGRTWCH